MPPRLPSKLPSLGLGSVAMCALSRRERLPKCAERALGLLGVKAVVGGVEDAPPGAPPACVVYAVHDPW